MDLSFDRRAIDLAFLHGKPYWSEIFLAKGFFVEQSFRILVVGCTGPQHVGWRGDAQRRLAWARRPFQRGQINGHRIYRSRQMGSAIALNLVKAGHRLVVSNRSAEKVEPLVRAGSRRAANPAECADGEIVVTMLADDRAVERVVFGEDGLLAARKPVLHLDEHDQCRVGRATRHSTWGSGRKLRLGPGVGRPVAAGGGKLFIVAAGPATRSTFASQRFRRSVSAPSGSAMRSRPRT